LKAADAFGAWSESGLINIDVTYDVMINSFSTNDAPFAITGPWAVGSFSDVNYVVEPIPPVEGGTPRPFIGVQGFMVAANAQNPLIAETFVLDIMASEDAQVSLFEAGGRPPTRQPSQWRRPTLTSRASASPAPTASRCRPSLRWVRCGAPGPTPTS
jgi:arabinogalactan oligomer/maltooligosaccharide transport system substrate-binding protein